MIRPLEALPTAYEQRLLARRAGVAKLTADPTKLDVFDAVIRKLGRWTPGSTVRCAFSGGSKELRVMIEKAAKEWENHGNIRLSFRDSTGNFLEWSHTDLAFHAEIRVGFDQPGYWSLVGADSVDTSVTTAHEASMNFSGFLQNLPADWEATVLHEFGHALGFEHEHQNPKDGCDKQFRWDDDAGYHKTVDKFGQYIIDKNGRRPGIYTVLGGPPNNWQPWKVDHNLRQLEDSSAYDASTFDPKSIMKYFFEPWMFVDGKQCSCYSEQNLTLSEGDKAGMASAYPKAPLDQLTSDEHAALDHLLSSSYPAEGLRQRLNLRVQR
jgi:hypothetical protein